MKRILLAALAALLALSFAACGAPELTNREILKMAEDILEDKGKIIVDEDEYEQMQDRLEELERQPLPTPTAAPTPEPELQPLPTPEPDSNYPDTLLPVQSETDPSMLLGLEDCDVYIDGEIVPELSGRNSEDVFFSIAQDYDYPDKVLQTARGIRIGSTLEDVVNAYGDIVASILGTYTEVDITLSDYLQMYPDEAEAEEITIICQAGFVGDTILSVFEFYEYLEDNGIDFGEYLDNADTYYEKYGISTLDLWIDIEDGIVSNITLVRY